MLSAGLVLMSLVVVQVAEAQEWQSAISAGDYARARVELERALGEQPENTALRYELARVLEYEGRNEEALAEYDLLLSRFPDNADYLLGRAQILSRLGQTSEAILVVENALELAPDYEDLWQLRLQLAERTAEAESTDLLRAETAARFPAATWWQRPSRPTEYTRSISVGSEHDSLSNDAPDWSRRFVRLDWRQTESASYFGEVVRSSRFGRSDESLLIGGEWQATRQWWLGGGLAGAADADFEAESALSVKARRPWAAGWGTQFQLRRREYPTATVSSYAVTGDKYFSDYRVAYGLNYSRLHGAGTSVGHTVSLGWYPTERRSLSISAGSGEEIETVGLGQLLRTDVRNLTLSGRQSILTRYTMNWWLGTHRQGDFYRRSYAGISVRIEF